ncbi:MAG: low molecular weight protein-tyrosine-phosphatase [Bacteroidales bacterium]
MKILMVCMGNICRSPLAEGIMTEKQKKYNLDIEVDSAGTGAYHVNEPPDPRSVEIAMDYGIDITHQRARMFTVEDFERFDKIFVMDHENYAHILAMAKNQDHKNKVDLIMNNAYPGKNMLVPDPYYGGDDGFKNVFMMLDEACETIAQEIFSQNTQDEKK